MRSNEGRRRGTSFWSNDWQGSEWGVSSTTCARCFASRTLGRLTSSREQAWGQIVTATRAAVTRKRKALVRKRRRRRASRTLGMTAWRPPCARRCCASRRSPASAACVRRRRGSRGRSARGSRRAKTGRQSGASASGSGGSSRRRSGRCGDATRRSERRASSRHRPTRAWTRRIRPGMKSLRTSRSAWRAWCRCEAASTLLDWQRGWGRPSAAPRRAPMHS
mmetsp:Transcript_19487/g.61995  ORF Transcript_19487/g.61995 Transcript_19487/m.61995 type:complete len:221 (-) Transcript_19487:106-768(-)